MPRHKKRPERISPRVSLLDRIQNADLPKDASNFTLIDLQAARLTDNFKRGTLGESDFKQLVLLVHQTRLLRQECDKLRTELDGLRPYVSSKRLKAALEINPIKSAELKEEARKEEGQVEAMRLLNAQEVRLEVQRRVMEHSKKPWKWRDDPIRGRYPRLWHKPMTRADYREATGLSRPTIRKILRTLDSRPSHAVSKENEAELFPARVNFAFFCRWLRRYVRNQELQRAYFVQDLLLYYKGAACDVKHFWHATFPVHALVVGSTRAQQEDFLKYLSNAIKLFHPPPPPTPSLSLGI